MVSELITLKKVLTPFRHISDIIARTLYPHRILSVTESRLYPATYHVRVVNNIAHAGAGYSIPASGYGVKVDRGLLFFNSCNENVFTVGQLVSSSVAKLMRTEHSALTQGHMNWLMVNPKPKLYLGFSDRDVTTPPFNAALLDLDYREREHRVSVNTHSIIQIKTRNNTKYIADFTGEQFGFGSDNWLLDKEQYYERYVESECAYSWPFMAYELMKRSSYHCFLTESLMTRYRTWEMGKEGEEFWNQVRDEKRENVAIGWDSLTKMAKDACGDAKDRLRG